MNPLTNSRGSPEPLITFHAGARSLRPQKPYSAVGSASIDRQEPPSSGQRCIRRGSPILAHFQSVIEDAISKQAHKGGP
jgi:hypothetical protein